MTRLGADAALPDVIRAYQDACSGVVARYDGFIAKFRERPLCAQTRQRR